ncbi:peptidase M4 family protein, partial [Pseudomonas fragi]
SGFLRFARITYDVAGRLYGANKDEQKAVKEGWKAVGISV